MSRYPFGWPGQNLSLKPDQDIRRLWPFDVGLRYEMNTYEEARHKLPEVGDDVITPDGEGRVEAIEPTTKAVHVKLHESGLVRDFSWKK